jgi:hypothetical protein
MTLFGNPGASFAVTHNPLIEHFRTLEKGSVSHQTAALSAGRFLDMLSA